MGLGTLRAVRECESPRCKADVVDALSIAVGKGGHKDVVLDPEPVTWDQGGRFRLRPHQPGGKPQVTELRSAGQAFGGVPLYLAHKLSCGGGTGVKARSKESA